MLCCVRYFCPCVRFSLSPVKRLPRRQSLHFTYKINTSFNIRFPKSLGFIDLIKETNFCTVQRHWHRQRATTVVHIGTGTDSALQL